MPSSRLDNNERPVGVKNSVPYLLGFFLDSSWFSPFADIDVITAYPVEESAHCSFGQLSKLPVAVPKSAVQ